MYLPLMLQCRLIRETQSNRTKTVNIIPCIAMNNYSWSDFMSKHKLNIKTSFVYLEGSKAKTYFIHIGGFRCTTERFTILDQIHGAMKFKYSTKQDHQKIFVEAIAKEEMPLLSSSSISSSITTTNTKS